MKIIVIGGSAGSLAGLKKIMSNLTREMNAAIFVVVHFPADKTSFLPKILSRDCRMPVEHAKNEAAIEPGKVYIALPDHHLVIKDGKMLLGNGPKENRFRPSIDVLFRSAALAYDSLVTGIILSGLLDDGVAGLSVIKKMKGITIVQDPEDAEFSSMPINALKQVNVDHCVPSAEIAPIINNLPDKPLKENLMEKNDSLDWENKISLGMNKSFDSIEKFASPTRYICPLCEGPLFHLKDENLQRYRCFVGHAFTSASLLEDISEKIEHLVNTTFRTMDEKREMIDNIPEQTEDLLKQKEQILAQIDLIKKLLQ